MMNQRELRAYYERRAKLREAVLTLEGLREYGFYKSRPRKARI